MKLVGRLRAGDPRARAGEQEVARFFEPTSRGRGSRGFTLSGAPAAQEPSGSRPD